MLDHSTSSNAPGAKTGQGASVTDKRFALEPWNNISRNYLRIRKGSHV